MANLNQNLETNKFVHLVRGEVIDIQITFEKENRKLIPIHLMMYSHASKSFMDMTHKMHGVFFRAIVDAEITKLNKEHFVIPVRDIEHGDMVMEEETHISNRINEHFEREHLGL